MTTFWCLKGWIAAIALQYDLTLVTRDEHFKQVEGVSLEAKDKTD